MKIAKKLAKIWMILVAFAVLYGPIVWLACQRVGWKIGVGLAVAMAVTAIAYWLILEGDL